MKYKLFGKTGLKVSELCLGTMGFGTEWGWGADFDTSKAIFDTFANAGGNFIDTANRYTEGTSEKFIADFIKTDRHHFVIATKYSLHDNQTNVNASGNNRKNMMRSVEASLRRLQIDCIDVFYLHAWDALTPYQEVMRGLDDLVRQGKVNYIAISDTPAWVVSKANLYSELNAMTTFAGLQVEYSLLQRTPERDLIPMAIAEGMTILPWAPLAGGALSGKYLRGDKGRLPEKSARLNERSVAITEEVVAIAAELECAPAHVALAWTMQRGFSSIPIVGATKVSQVEENLKAIEIQLSTEQIHRLDSISAIELGFPHDFLAQEGVKNVLFGGFQGKIIGRG